MKSTVSSPGERLKQLLREQGIKHVELAASLGRSGQYISDIIKGKKQMDVDLAIELSRALPNGPKAAEWMEMAVKHRLARLEPTRTEVIARNEYAKELIRMKWVDGDLPPTELEQALKEFWADEKYAVNFRLSAAHRVNERARQAWAIQVYRIATGPAKAHIAAYDAAKMPELFKQLKKLMRHFNGVTRVQELVESFGIRFVILPNPKGCAVDGIAALNNGQPYIGVSLRIARLDSFWFTVWHELMHIYYRHSAVIPDILDVPLVRADDAGVEEQLLLEAEEQANAGAREHMLPEARYTEFILRGDYTLKAIEKAASDVSVHPSILIGRLKRDGLLDWNQFAREHPIVRDVLLPGQAA